MDDATTTGSSRGGSRFDQQRNVLWANARARAARRAAPKPARPRRLSSAEVAEQHARQAETAGMPQSAAVIREVVEALPRLYPKRGEQPDFDD